MSYLFWGYPPEFLARFKKFHLENPHIYRLFEKLAIFMIEKGRKKYAARTIIERIRWHMDAKTVGDEVFEINDNYIALYARLFIYRHPNHLGFFELRTVRSRGLRSEEERRRREEGGGYVH